MSSKLITRNYVVLTFFNTLAASFIWGVNTLFLLDAGLSNFEAFAANAFFSLGTLLFEVPTGVVADTMGRRMSYLIGTGTLFASTLVYLILWHYKSPFPLWCLASLFLGLGFTFFSGAVEAWLVDALHHTGFTGNLEDVFSKGQISSGAAMLLGSISGGYIAETFDLGAPYLFRIGALLVSFIIATIYMKDLGFSPRKMKSATKEMKAIFSASLDNGIKIPSVRWAMLTSPFIMGVGFYGFYAAQPLLLELYHDEKAYGVAGLAAALIAVSQIIGGSIVPWLRRIFSRRSHVMAVCIVMGSGSMVALGLTEDFWTAVALIGLWAMSFAAFSPVQQAYINNCLASDQRATILSFNGLVGSAGGVAFQPALGKVADFYSYSTSYAIAGVLQIGALPFVWLAGRANPTADKISGP